jgi:hypothetical protein
MNGGKMKRNKLHVILVGVKDHPMFVVLPYKTNSQRDKYYRELEQKKTITLPTDGEELKVLPLRYIGMATITTERTFGKLEVEKGDTKDVISTSTEANESGDNLVKQK